MKIYVVETAYVSTLKMDLEEFLYWLSRTINNVQYSVELNTYYVEKQEDLKMWQQVDALKEQIYRIPNAVMPNYLDSLTNDPIKFYMNYLASLATKTSKIECSKNVNGATTEYTIESNVPLVTVTVTRMDDYERATAIDKAINNAICQTLNSLKDWQV